MSETPPSPSVMTRMTGVVGGLPGWAQATIVVLVVFLIGGIAGWIGRGQLAGRPDVTTMNVYQDWHLLCPDSKDKDDSCEMSEDVLNGQQGQRLARIVLYKDKDKNMVMAVTVPLEVYLEPGLGLKLGDDQVRVFQYKTCTEAGCLTVIPVDKAMLDSLYKAQDSSVVVASPQDGKPVELAFSMKGYTQAYDAFLSNEADRKSWFRRLWL